jgi:hypothetical protein
MLNSTKSPLKKAKIVLKDIGDEAVLYNSETKAIHILNKTSAMIWEYCDGKHSVEMIEKQIRNKFQISSSQDVKNDIRQTINQFNKLGLIEQ